ncbi:MAG: hypothetical protein Q8K24_07055 [Hydrogenophaga sp.]|nr:hypothetical protein [Hydrogenophaga sp.]
MKDAVVKETLAGGMQKHVGPANAAALLTTTVAGFMVTLAGDLLGPSLPTYAFGVLAIVWVLVILIAVALIGRDAAATAGYENSAGIAACLRLGFARAMVEKRYAFILLLMSFCAVYAAWAQHRQKTTVEKISGGMETLQLIAGDTAQGVDAVRKDLASDELTLLKMGYGSSEEHAWRAFSEGNVPAMEIMRRLNRQHFPATLLDKPSALENLIQNPNADVAGALAMAKASKAELDRPRHIESSYTGAFKVPQRKGIFESLGFTAVRVLPDGGGQKRGETLYMVYDDNVPWTAEVSPCCWLCGRTTVWQSKRCSKTVRLPMEAPSLPRVFSPIRSVDCGPMTSP